MNIEREIISEKKLKYRTFSDDHSVDLNVYQCGWEKCAPTHTFGPSAYNHFLFHYVLSGKGKLTTNRQTYPIQTGQGFLLSPGQVSTYSADGEEPWEYAWLEFDGLRVRGYLAEAGLGEKTPVYIPAGAEAGRRVRARLMEIVDQNINRPAWLTGHALLFLDQLVQSSGRKPRMAGQSLRDCYLKEAISYIAAHYQQDISVEELATVCGLNRSYFGRIFKEGLGRSPQQFLLRYRMTKAADLLNGTALSIRDIGNAVGYDNQLHFSRAFKSVFQVSPRKYRQSRSGQEMTGDNWLPPATPKETEEEGEN